MKGTMICVKWAMRLMPPNMMMPSTVVTLMPAMSLLRAMSPRKRVLIIVSPPKATSVAFAIAFDCTPGKRKPQAISVVRAKIQAYHFWPSAFSM